MKLTTSCLIVTGLFAVAPSTMKPFEMNIHHRADLQPQDSYFLPLCEAYDGKQSYASEFAHEECNYDQNAYELFLHLDYTELQIDTTMPQAPDAPVDSIKPNDVSEGNDNGNDMSINTMQQLEDLINARLRKQKLMCCDRIFDSISHLEIHLTHSHRVDNKLSCFNCDFDHKHASFLAQHLRRHLDEAIYQCPQCFKNSVNIAGLKIHFKKHLAQSNDQNDSPKTCNVHNHTTLDDMCMQSQCMELIELREKGIEKKCCNINHESKKSLQKHLIAHHSTANEAGAALVLANVEKYLLNKDRTLYACPHNDCGQLHQSSSELLDHYVSCVRKKTLRNNLIKNLKRKGVNADEYGALKKQRLV